MADGRAGPLGRHARTDVASRRAGVSATPPLVEEAETVWGVMCSSRSVGHGPVEVNTSTSDRNGYQTFVESIVALL